MASGDVFSINYKLSGKTLFLTLDWGTESFIRK
jgi:hypothetical protein